MSFWDALDSIHFGHGKKYLCFNYNSEMPVGNISSVVTSNRYFGSDANYWYVDHSWNSLTTSSVSEQSKLRDSCFAVAQPIITKICTFKTAGWNVPNNSTEI